MLCLEEKALAEMSNDSPAAMVAASQRDASVSPPSEPSGHSHTHRERNNNHRTRGSNDGKKNGGARGSGSGGSNRREGGRGSGGAQPTQVQ